MGVEDIEGSPTYSLVNTYDSVAFGRINHFDLYRLNSEEEAFDIGIEEMLYGGDYCFIEWPSKIENLLPENTIWVRISINDENERIISVEIE
jgi:tRNA threonylcarbamoyladenosine biosynthesis protein TsaE